MSDMITITGNLAADPELRRLPTGVVVTNFRVGTTHRWYDRGTEAWVDSPTNWYQVSAFRRLGDHAFQSLRKGAPVVVTGKLRVKDYESGEGKKLSVEIEASAIGHDLRWGTTVFTKDASGGAEASGDVPSDAWSVPDAAADTPPAEEEDSGASERLGAVPTPF